MYSYTKEDLKGFRENEDKENEEKIIYMEKNIEDLVKEVILIKDLLRQQINNKDTNGR